MSYKLIFKFKQLALAVLVTVCFLLPIDTQAQVNVWGDVVSGGGATVGLEAVQAIGLGNRDPRIIIASIVQVILGFLGVLAVLFILYAGFLWMTAAGNEEKIASAKEILTHTIVGLLIILSAFAIATFVLRALLGSTGRGLGAGGFDGAGNSGALSALGNGPIRSVYPTPNQREVPRNTGIIISFRDTLDPASICAPVLNGRCAPDAQIIPDNIKIFQSNIGDQTDQNVTAVKIASTDNRTFVLTPEAYLGTPTDKIWYTVGLSSRLEKAGGSKVFSMNGFAWQFEVSNILDLEPPQVLVAGIFPMPDNAQDQLGDLIPAKSAQAKLVVNAQPQTARPWLVSYTKSAGSVEIDIKNAKLNSCNGLIDLAINNTTPLTANIAYREMSGMVDDSQLAIIDRRVQTGCGLEIVLDDGFRAGHSWQLTLATERQADVLIVGNTSYSFVDELTGANQIVVGSDLTTTASNISTALKTNSQVSASTVDQTINLVSTIAGATANKIELLFAGVQDTISISPFAGGADRSTTMKVVDRKDKSKNASIQINFNEAINPLALSGRSETLRNSIRVINLSDGSELPGEFLVSNQFKTVEFRSDLECGVNGCGETMYCLPGNANIQIELNPATLKATCSQADDCLSKAPYLECFNSLCYDPSAKAYYPEGFLGSGLLDLASNSLDANRDGRAVGPLAIYNENTSQGQGDRYQSSFWTSDFLDLTAPNITFISPNYNQAKVDINEAVVVNFDKLMLSSTLNSGSYFIGEGKSAVEHFMVNLSNRNNKPVGYWIEKTDRELTNPPDNEADETSIIIKHSAFMGSNKYRAQIGSGVKDIYQNCYKPSAGPSCLADSALPSCCNGVPSDLGAGGRCD